MTPISVAEVLQQYVNQPKAEATSREEYKQPAPKVPLKGRAIFFKDDDSFADGPLMDIIVGDDQPPQYVRDILEKLLATDAGIALVETLSDMLYDRNTGKYKTKIHLMFVGEARSGVSEECGHINRYTDVTEYWVTLKRYAWDGPPLVVAGPGVTGVARCGAKYPPNAQKKEWEMNVCFIDDSIAMGVECVYHELAHIWFIKGGAKRERSEKGLAAVKVKWPSGHENYGAGQFEPGFRDMLLKMNSELNAPYAAALKAYNDFVNHP